MPPETFGQIVSSRLALSVTRRRSNHCLRRRSDPHQDAALFREIHVPDDLRAVVDERRRMHAGKDAAKCTEHRGIITFENAVKG